MKQFWTVVRLWWLVAGCLLLGCAEIQLPDSIVPEIELPAILSSPTPQPEPTPLGNSLSFQIPSPRFNPLLRPGERIPETQLEFINKQGEVYNVRIDGFTAQKQAGDSFSWRGIIAPGVIGTYNLNLLRTLRDTDLSAQGAVTIDVLEPAPIERGLPADVLAANIMRNVKIDDVIPLNQPVPGTSLIWLGEQNGFVEFGGTAGLPRYAIGDTLRWIGALRPNVYTVYDVKIVGIEQYGLRLAGAAELYIFQSPPQ